MFKIISLKIILIYFILLGNLQSAKCLVANTYALWDKGQTILVSYQYDVDPELKKLTRSIAKIWEQHANIVFEFVDVPGMEGDITIISDPNRSAFSHLGTYSKSFKGSMNLPLEKNFAKIKKFNVKDHYYMVIKRTVLHEFGHALGLDHEHQNPLADLCWDETAVFKYCKTLNPPRPKEMCKFSFLKKEKDISRVYSNYDRYSIMHYQIDQKLTTCVYSAPVNTELSLMDKRWIQIIYPFEESRSYIDSLNCSLSLKEIQLLASTDEGFQNDIELYGRIALINNKNLPDDCYHDIGYAGCYKEAFKHIEVLWEINKQNYQVLKLKEAKANFDGSLNLRMDANDIYYLYVELVDKDWLSEDDVFNYSEKGIKHFKALLIPVNIFHLRNEMPLNFEVSNGFGRYKMTLDLQFELKYVGI